MPRKASTTEQRAFRSLDAFKKVAKRRGCRAKCVTRGKTNDYWQAIHPKLGIVGFFNTGFKSGSIRGWR